MVFYSSIKLMKFFVNLYIIYHAHVRDKYFEVFLIV